MDVVMLDTNAYTAYLAGNGTVLDLLGRAELAHLSFFVLAELLTGFRGGTKETANRRALDRFLAKPTVQLTLPTRRTAEYFSLIKSRLREKGTPIPINDVWIAAHALELGALLVTADAHFEHVEGLRRA